LDHWYAFICRGADQRTHALMVSHRWWLAGARRQQAGLRSTDAGMAEILDHRREPVPWASMEPHPLLVVPSVLCPLTDGQAAPSGVSAPAACPTP